MRNNRRCGWLGLLIAGPAWAFEPPVRGPCEFQPPRPGGHELTSQEWGWSVAAGSGGALVLGTAAGAIGFFAVDDEDDLAGLGQGGGVLIALPLGVSLGASLAVYWYGEGSGHDGRFLATLAGGTVGGLVGIGLLAGSVAIDENLVWVGLLGLLVSPAVGATIGYSTSLEPTATGALLDYDPTAGLRLGLPAVGLGRQGDDTRVGLPLLGGRF